eukprot:12880495-Prorocentrum_lima.AAC.1
MEKAVDKIVGSATSTAGISDGQEAELKSYRAIAHFRFRLGKIWAANIVEEARRFSTAAVDDLFKEMKVEPGVDRKDEAADAGAAAAAEAVANAL